MDATPALPLLIIVAGPPASGKTTLADRLSDTLQLPLIHRDPITEALADILRPSARDDMEPITQASFRAFYTLIAGHLARGSGVVCETNFHSGVAEADLRPIIAHARAILIRCQVDRELSIRRFIDRFERGERHWCYFDEERIAEIHAGRGQEPWDRAEPLELDVPTLTVDTTNGFDPSLEDLAHLVRISAATVGHSEPDDAANPNPRPLTPIAHVCPELGFADDPPNYYSHPTHLHRCYAGLSPVRLSTQQQRDLCLTEGFISCPRLVGAYEPKIPSATAAAKAAPTALSLPLTTSHPPEASPLIATGGRAAVSADGAKEFTIPHSARTRYVARGVFVVGGFALGVTLAAIALLALFSADRPLDLSEDELSRLAANAASRPTTGLRAPGRVLPTQEAPPVDLSPSIAGIQQPAPGIESTAAAEPTAGLTPTREPPTPGPGAGVRRATIQAPAGFNSAFLREAPATSARSVRQLSNGTPVEVLEGSAAGDGFTWARVRTEDGAAGWVVATAVGG